MVGQNTLRRSEGNQVFFRKNLKFAAAVDIIHALNIKNDLIVTSHVRTVFCATILYKCHGSDLNKLCHNKCNKTPLRDQNNYL